MTRAAPGSIRVNSGTTRPRLAGHLSSLLAPCTVALCFTLIGIPTAFLTSQALEVVGTTDLDYGGSAIQVDGTELLVGVSDFDRSLSRDNGWLQSWDITDPLFPLYSGTEGLGQRSGIHGLEIAVLNSVRFTFIATADVYADEPDWGILRVRPGSASVDLPHGARAVAVSEARFHAYVVTADVNDGGADAGTFHVFDIYETVPTLLGSIDLPYGGHAVTVRGDYAYIGMADVVPFAEDAGALVVMDIADPLNPVIVASSDLVTGARAVALCGNTLFVASTDFEDLDPDAGAFTSVDISDPSNPLVHPFISLNWGGRAIALAGTHAYVATADVNDDSDDFGTLDVIDISSPETPALVGSTSLSAGGHGIAICDDPTLSGYAFVATSDISSSHDRGWLDLVDISDFTPAYVECVPQESSMSIQPVEVLSTSEWGGGGTDGRAINLIDGSGLSGAGPVESQTHDDDASAATMWHAGDVDGGLGGPVGTPPVVDGQALIFDLGGEFDLLGAYIWNHNQSALEDRGVAGFQLLVSSDPDPLTATFSPIDVFTLAVAAGGAAEPAQLISFEASGVRLVKFDIGSAHSGLAEDYVGLSEVRFRGSPVLVSTPDTDVGIAQRPALLHAARNPGRSLSYRVLLEGATTGRLEVFDVLGRRVYEHDVPRTGPAGSLVRVAGVDLVPGVYFAQLRLEASTWTLRSVLIP